MLKEGNGVFLLLSRCIDVGEEERDIMSADNRHNSVVVESLRAPCLFVSLSSVVRPFALIERIVTDSGLEHFGRFLSDVLDPSTNFINVLLGKEILRLVKGSPGACRHSMSMVEVTIKGNMNIGATTDLSEHIHETKESILIEALPKRLSSETGGAPLPENAVALIFVW